MDKLPLFLDTNIIDIVSIERLSGRTEIQFYMGSKYNSQVYYISKEQHVELVKKALELKPHALVV